MKVSDYAVIEFYKNKKMIKKIENIAQKFVGYYNKHFRSSYYFLM